MWSHMDMHTSYIRMYVYHTFFKIHCRSGSLPRKVKVRILFMCAYYLHDLQCVGLSKPWKHVFFQLNAAGM